MQCEGRGDFDLVLVCRDNAVTSGTPIEMAVKRQSP